MCIFVKFLVENDWYCGKDFGHHVTVLESQTKTNWPFTDQGSRVRPIWSHVRPNFSRVRLTKIPGRTGASSHSGKRKKSIRDSETQQKTLPLGLYRGLNQSEIVKGGPPPLIGRGPDIPVCVCALTNASRVLLQSDRERKRWVVEMRAVLPT